MEKSQEELLRTTEEIIVDALWVCFNKQESDPKKAAIQEAIGVVMRKFGEILQ